MVTENEEDEEESGEHITIHEPSEPGEHSTEHTGEAEEGGEGHEAAKIKPDSPAFYFCVFMAACKFKEILFFKSWYHLQGFVQD